MHGRGLGKLSDLPKQPKPSHEIPPSAKEKRECWGSGLGLQRKAIHMETEKKGVW